MMKFFGLLCALFCASAFGTTYVPVQLLNPNGSTSGQVPVSTGPTTAPTWGNVPATALAAQAANTVVANVAGSTASPTAFAMPSCATSTSALQYTSGTGFTCYANSASLTGATFTGALGASYNSATFTLNDAGGTGFPVFFFNKAGTNVWALTNASSTGTLTLNRYVSGTLTDSPISVSNSTGAVTMSDGITNSPISGSTGSFTTLAASGAVSGAGFNNLFASPPNIGLVAPAAGKFTTLQATSSLTGFTGRLLNIQVFTSTGTYTPTTGTAAVYVKVQAGGGAGGGTPATSTGQAAAGTGGTAGAYAEGYYTSGFSGVAVTIGAGGTASSGANGGAGATSSFGSLLSCPGGAGGLVGTASASLWVTASAAQTSACTGTPSYAMKGQQGEQSVVFSGPVSRSGAGASAVMGIGGAALWSSGAGLAGIGYGSAGGGANAAASTAAQAGSGGSPGLVEVFEYSQ
ncbi:hypothetical protein P0D71_00640 [Paraburkholderia sp. RL17-383-BIF-A]|uniref:hypothetical protein n=1 Tax=Paraburkholderia sp. RL17-383-BIF-A TaxID=3031631 RepID=UPI0038BB1055